MTEVEKSILVCIQIGNSDNKLTQEDWKNYCDTVQLFIEVWGNKVHFAAPSVGWQNWQNACWVVECKQSFVDKLKENLVTVRKLLRQESLVWLEGTPEFI